MTSRFKGIFDARQKEAEAAIEESPPPSPAPPERPEAKPKLTEKRSGPKPPPKATGMPKPRGRPTGKRSDSEFGQVTAYVRKETHHAVKVALLQDGGGREFSELVEELLAKWLKART